MDRNLALEAVRVTEAAALSASRWMGRGDEKAADQAAVDAMREALNSLSIAGTVVIGEGERDEAPMLYIGEKVGTGNGPPLDIALDPLEGTTITAKGSANALAVIAMADAGGFLNAPDVYMDKIAVGGGLPDDLVDLDEEPATNLKNLAKAKKAEVADLVVCILDRPRHAELIAKVRGAGARIALIGDGDVSGVMATSDAETGIDIYVGSGGAPEGVLAAAALRCIGGQMQGRLLFRNDDERGRARRIGITDLDRKYKLLDLASGDVMFAATGVTNGTMLRGVRRFPGGASTHSVPVFDRITTECVDAPPGNRRTPRSIVPLVTPVAANITSPEARSKSLYLRSRSVTPRRRARPRSSSLRNNSRPCIWPPMQRNAAAASTPSGAPPEPTYMSIPVSGSEVAMTPLTSPSEINAMRAPAARTLAISSA